MKDREASLEIRRLDVGDETPLKPRTQPVLERGNFLGRTVGRDDDLLVDLVQCIESVEELLLGAVLAGEELHVVDQQHVDSSVLMAELSHARGRDRADHLVGELLGRQIDDALAWKTVVNLMADGMHEVGLAQPHPSVEEERVVAVTWSLSDGFRGGVRELRVMTDHE